MTINKSLGAELCGPNLEMHCFPHGQLCLWRFQELENCRHKSAASASLIINFLLKVYSKIITQICTIFYLDKLFRGYLVAMRTARLILTFLSTQCPIMSECFVSRSTLSSHFRTNPFQSRTSSDGQSVTIRNYLFRRNILKEMKENNFCLFELLQTQSQSYRFEESLLMRENGKITSDYRIFL